MTVQKNTFLLKCFSCCELLTPPVVSTDCSHDLHKHCFKKINSPKKCPECYKTVLRAVSSHRFDSLISRLTHTVQHLIQSPPYEPETWKNRLVHQTVIAGDLEALSYLNHKEPCLMNFEGGISPLYRSCYKGHLAMTRFILKAVPSAVFKTNDLSVLATSDPEWMINDLESHHKATPLHGAVLSGCVEVVALLLTHPAPINEKDSLGRTPLLQAISLKRSAIAKLLLQLGADPRLTDHRAISPLMMASQLGLLDVVEALLDRGVSVEEFNESGDTCLHRAARNNKPDVVSLLLRNGAHKIMNERWLDLWTPLFLAVQRGDLESVKLLVQAGADLTLLYDGKTILHIAQNCLEEHVKFYKENPKHQEEARSLIRMRIAEYLKVHCQHLNRKIRL